MRFSARGFGYALFSYPLKPRVNFAKKHVLSWPCGTIKRKEREMKEMEYYKGENMYLEEIREEIR